MAVGRISGPMLKANLLRDGVDLAFETDLVYLDVNNLRVGIKTDSPTHDLTVNGTTRSTNLLVDNQLDIGGISITGNTITGTDGFLNLVAPTNNFVNYQTRLRVDSIEVDANVISTNTSNTNLEFRPNGTGTVDVFSDTNINGNLYVSGDIRLDGNINIGNQPSDVVVINADVGSNIIPSQDNQFTLGSADRRWKDLYVTSVYADNVIVGDIVVDNINLNLRQGNMWYVAQNGDDNNSGTHQNDPYRTVKHALSQAQSGDTVFIYAGTYEEIFPLTVPVGVTVKGVGLRSVKIVPTLATNNKDCFLLNGEVTIEDLTIGDFFYNSATNEGYGFRFAPNFTVTSRSPYIRNVSVLNKGSVTSVNDPLGFDQGDAGKGALINGTVANVLSKEASCLFHSVTFITPNADAITATGGVRVEWLNSFTYFANRGFYALSSSTGFAGQGKTEIRLTGTSGTFNVGDTVTYYNTDGISVLASGTIAKKDADGKIYLTGKRVGFATADDRDGKIIQAVADAKLSTSVKKWGTASLALDGTGDAAFVQSNTDFEFGTDDFTLEFWIYRTNTSAVEGFLDFRTLNPQNSAFLYSNGSSLYYYVNGVNAIAVAGALSSPNTWYHVAVSRSSGNTRLFVNGNQVGLTFVDTTNYISSPLTIGNNYNYTAGVSGYIDDLRISKGIGRYTSNFTAPTSIVSNDQYTVLLSRFDGANASTAFVDETILPQDVRSSSGGTAQFITLVDYSDFGAEIRSIASAAVYGNYGVVGDGLGVIGYMIGQNLAYIGVGKRTDNDPTYVIQDNEVVEGGGAKIYYSSVDHKGDFRVGDLFYVNQQDGTVTFTSAAFNVSSTTGLTFTNGTAVTNIDGTKVETGNLRLSGNTLESTSGPVNLLAANDQINLTNNVSIGGNLDVTGNVTIAGNITIGDQPADNITFLGSVASNMIPSANNTYSIGSASKQWLNIYADKASISGIEITDNVIRTVDSNADLELLASGAGRILIPSNNVQISQNLTVNGSTALKDTTINGTITHTGSVNQAGNYTQTGTLRVGGALTVSQYGQFDNIRIEGNAITTTTVNSDLNLQANGTGRILIPSDDVTITQNLTVNGTFNSGSLNVTNTVTANQFSTGNILIDDNFITTTQSNSNLELTANGTGKISIPENSVVISQSLNVNGSTSLKATAIAGQVSHTGDVVQTGNYTQTGNTTISGSLTVGTFAQLQSVKIDGNTITTTTLNTDLVLQANGSGRIYIPSDNVQINNSLTVDATLTTDSATVTNTVTANQFTTGNVFIDDNFITTTQTNSNLELRAYGSGLIYVPNNSVQFDQGLTVNGTTSLKNTTIGAVGSAATLTQVGAVTHTGNYTQTGDYSLTGTLTVSDRAQFKDVRIDGNVITTTIGNNDLILEAAGTGRVYVPSDDVRIDQNLTVVGTTTVGTLNSSGTVTATTFNNGNITITGNTISTTVSNSNLQLQAAGTGLVELEQLRVQNNEISTANNSNISFAPNGTGIVSINSTQSIKVPVGTTEQRPVPAQAGMVRFNTTLSQFEGFDGTNWIRFDGLYDADGNSYVSAELSYGVNDGIFRFVSNGTQIAQLDSARLAASNLDVDSININNNVISTTTSNADLILQTQGTGSVRIANFNFNTNIITNITPNAVTTIAQSGNGYFKIGDTNGFAIPRGTSDQRPGNNTVEVGMTRFNTDDGRIEVYNGSNWVSAAGTSAGLTRAEAEDIAIVSAIIFG